MPKKPFTKGHKKFYIGKKVGLTEFCDLYDAYWRREVSISEAARRLGVSQPTFRKWVLMTLQNGNSIAGLYFIRENNINADNETD
jgi:hypothetical protein